jgi:hypothetical protein
MRILFLILTLISAPLAFSQDADPTEPEVEIVDFTFLRNPPSLLKVMPMHTAYGEGYIVYDWKELFENGDIAVRAGVVELWQRAEGFSATHGFPTISKPRSKPLRSCYTNFRHCKDMTLKNCAPLKGDFFYEMDLTTGAAATNMPMTKGLQLPEGSATFQRELCPSPLT